LGLTLSLVWVLLGKSPKLDPRHLWILLGPLKILRRPTFIFKPRFTGNSFSFFFFFPSKKIKKLKK
jgi:hypothetical protein